MKKLIIFFGMCLVSFNCGKGGDGSSTSSFVPTPKPEPEETTTQYTLTVSAGEDCSNLNYNPLIIGSTFSRDRAILSIRNKNVIGVL